VQARLLQAACCSSALRAQCALITLLITLPGTLLHVTAIAPVAVTAAAMRYSIVQVFLTLLPGNLDPSHGVMLVVVVQQEHHPMVHHQVLFTHLPLLQGLKALTKRCTP